MKSRTTDRLPTASSATADTDSLSQAKDEQKFLIASRDLRLAQEMVRSCAKNLSYASIRVLLLSLYVAERSNRKLRLGHVATLIGSKDNRTTHRYIDYVKEDGLLEVCEDPDDARQKILKPTAELLAIVENEMTNACVEHERFHQKYLAAVEPGDIQEVDFRRRRILRPPRNQTALDILNT